MKQSILITGASGFLGSWLVDEALKRDLQVYAGIRETSSKKYLQDPRIKFFYVKFDDPDYMQSELAKHQFDYIIHNAGLTTGKTEQDYITVNTDYAVSFLRSIQATQKSIKKFVFISSLAAVGPADNTPIGIVNHDTKPNPVTYYGKSKLLAERQLLEIMKVPYLFIRPTGIYGPRDTDIFLLFKAVKQGFAPIVGYDQHYISLIYVKDLAKLILDAALSSISNKAYFAGDGEVYTTEQLTKSVAKALNKKPLMPRIPIWMLKMAAAAAESVANIQNKASILNRDKAKEITAKNLTCYTEDIEKELHFHPDYSLDKGTKETADWYREQNWL